MDVGGSRSAAGVLVVAIGAWDLPLCQDCRGLFGNIGLGLIAGKLRRTRGSGLFIGMIGWFDPRELKEARRLATLITSGVSMLDPCCTFVAFAL